MTDNQWEFEDMYRMMTEDPEEARERHRKKRERKAVVVLAILCFVSTIGLVMCGPGDMDIESSAGASESQTFEEWYADEANREWYEFHQWYSAHYRNASYYHIRDEFGTGWTGDKAVQIAECESGLKPWASSPTNDHGIMQINRPSWERKFAAVTGVSWNNGVYHASYNAKFAKWLHDQTGGFSHWTCA